jgi:alpha-beta hydrolase superfamily lysophospholipase
MTTMRMTAAPVTVDRAVAATRGTRAQSAPGGLHLALWSLGLVSGGAAMLALGGTATLAHILTRPRHLRAIPARQIDETIEEITFPSEDGLTLCGWYLPLAAPRDVIVICHGFAMNRHELLDIARALRARGHAVLLFDFRGHGTSGGARTTIGYREASDIIAALDYLGTRSELAGLPLGVAGISMGGAATLLAAAREPRIAAIVADSSFAALSETATASLRQLSRWFRYPIGPLIIRFGELLTRVNIGINRPIDAIGTLAPRPVLIIHDTEDTFIPVRNAYALYEAARGPKELWVRPGRGHASLWLCCADEYVERLDRFFSRALSTGIAIAA